MLRHKWNIPYKLLCIQISMHKYNIVDITTLIYCKNFNLFNIYIKKSTKKWTLPIISHFWNCIFIEQIFEIQQVYFVPNIHTTSDNTTTQYNILMIGFISIWMMKKMIPLFQYTIDMFNMCVKYCKVFFSTPHIEDLFVNWKVVWLITCKPFAIWTKNFSCFMLGKACSHDLPLIFGPISSI